jgi:hypothetical protein
MVGGFREVQTTAEPYLNRTPEKQTERLLRSKTGRLYFLLLTEILNALANLHSGPDLRRVLEGSFEPGVSNDRTAAIGALWLEIMNVNGVLDCQELDSSVAA